MRAPRGSRRDERGVTAVEFALVLPLLFGLIGMAITGGLAFTYTALVHRSAEHAARVAAVPDMDMTQVTRSYATVDEIEAAAADAAILFQPTTVEVSCQPTPCEEGGRVTVRVSYVWRNPVAALLDAFSSGDIDNSFVLSATARKLVE